MSARRLNTPVAAYQFLVDVIGLAQADETHTIGNRIHELEIVNEQHWKNNTLVSEEYRQGNARSAEQRRTLRLRILEELRTIPRIRRDEDIRIGVGGALPSGSDVRSDRIAVLVIGPPASGKSMISAEIADHFGAVLLDPDFVKYKLPEFNEGRGAALVHEESDAIVFGDRRLSEGVEPLFEWAVRRMHNIVIPKVGKTLSKLQALRDELRKRQYKVHLVLVSLDRAIAVQRAYHRYREKHRYVPLGYIYDVVANEPQLTYYRTRTREKKKWESHAAYTTNVPLGHPPICECSGRKWPKNEIELRLKRRFESHVPPEVKLTGPTTHVVADVGTE